MGRISVGLLGLLSALLGCERPPVGGTPVDVDKNRVVLDLTTFLQDRPAIGGKWYDYSVDGHVLEPKAQAWILKAAVDSADVWGFRIASIYDDNSGETGLFTLDVVQRDQNTWTPSQRFVAPANVKDDGPVCVDLGTRSRVDCALDGWQLRFVLQSRLSVAAGFAVAEPAVFLAPGFVVARVDGLGSLAELPDPASVPVLDDQPSFGSSDWNFGHYASDLPAPGRVLGALHRVEGSAWSFVDANFSFVRFSLRHVDDVLRFSLQQQPIDRNDLSIAADLGPELVVDVDVSTLPVFVSFAAADLRTPDEDLSEATWPQQPPFANRYDLVVDGSAADVQLLLSPAAAALHLDP